MRIKKQLTRARGRNTVPDMKRGPCLIYVSRVAIPPDKFGTCLLAIIEVVMYLDIFVCVRCIFFWNAMDCRASLSSARFRYRLFW